MAIWKMSKVIVIKVDLGRSYGQDYQNINVECQGE